MSTLKVHRMVSSGAIISSKLAVFYCLLVLFSAALTTVYVGPNLIQLQTLSKTNGSLPEIPAERQGLQKEFQVKFLYFLPVSVYTLCQF